MTGTGTKYALFRDVLLRLDVRVPGKVPLLMSLKSSH